MTAGARPSSPASAWPRFAAPFSVVIALVGLLVMLGAIAASNDHSSAVSVATLIAGPVAAAVWLSLMLWFTGRWLAGSLTTRAIVWAFVASALLALVLVLLLVSESAVSSVGVHDSTVRAMAPRSAPADASPAA